MQIPDDAEARSAQKVFDRRYLIQPKDEVPDPKRPGEPLVSSIPVMPPSQRIQVSLDIRQIAEAVNDAVIAHDIKKVVDFWKNAKIKVEQTSEFHVGVVIEP